MFRKSWLLLVEIDGNDLEPQRRALAVLEKALGSLHPETAATLTSLAVSLDRQGKSVEAEAMYRRAVETSRNAGNPRSLLLNASRLGFALAKRGRNREALPFYREAIEALDFLYVRTRGLSEETRAAFMGQFGNIYIETIKLLLLLHRASPNDGFDRQILEIASRNQSRVFTELMRQADVGRFSSEKAFVDLRDRRNVLQDRMDTLRQAIVTVPIGQPQTEARRNDLTGQLEGATRELAVIERELLQRYPRFMELTNPKPVTVDDLQQRLLQEMTDHEWPVTFSIGIATFTRMPSSIEDMIRQADKLMYAVKNTSKGAIKQEVFAG